MVVVVSVLVVLVVLGVIVLLAIGGLVYYKKMTLKRGDSHGSFQRSVSHCSYSSQGSSRSSRSRYVCVHRQPFKVHVVCVCVVP